jgi:hypothetical protein
MRHTRVATAIAVAFALAAGSGLASAPASAAEHVKPFDEAVYVTCREAEAMDKEQRVDLVMNLADHAAEHHGIRFRDDEKTEQRLAGMIRAGCTMFPNATVHFIVSAAVRAEAEDLRSAR